jgi:hypothetical protein
MNIKYSIFINVGLGDDVEYLVILNAIVIILLYYISSFRKKDRLSEGKRFVYTYGEYKAIVIIDHKIEYKNGFFLTGGKLISGKTLAKACAVGMYMSNFLWNENKFPKTFNVDSSVYECVFVFLSKESFKISAEAVQHNPDGIIAFALKYTKDYPYDGPYGCIINESEMKINEIWSHTGVHEYIHCLSHYYFLDWDHYHKLWHCEDYLDKDGKNISQLAAEKTYIIMNID